MNMCRGSLAIVLLVSFSGCVSVPDIELGGDEPVPVVVSSPVCGAVQVPAPAAVPVPPLVTIEIVSGDLDQPLVATTVEDYEATAIWLGHLGGWVDQAAAWIASAQDCAVEGG